MDIDVVNQNMTESRIDNVKDSAKLKEKQELKEACDGFEAIFLKTVMKSMRETLPEDGLFKTSNEMDIYKSMHDEHLSEQISQGDNSVGISEFLYRQLQDTM
ncbi:MAG: rod-binding protein [Thermodesulfobacteriota bacterium]